MLGTKIATKFAHAQNFNSKFPPNFAHALISSRFLCQERHKLDPKARKCVLLGYGTETKGYRLYDPDRARVFHSRDVVFDEARMGIEKEPDREEQKERYIEIEHLSEEEAVADGEVEPVLRRSTRERRPPNPYGEWATVADR